MLRSLLSCAPKGKARPHTPTASPSDDGVDIIDDWDLKTRAISVFYKVRRCQLPFARNCAWKRMQIVPITSRNNACADVPISFSLSLLLSLALCPQADVDSDGFLSLEELACTMKKPQFVDTAMESYDRDKDGQVSLSEWCAVHKELFEKSAAAARSSLKSCEDMLARVREPPPEDASVAPPPVVC